MKLAASVSIPAHMSYMMDKDELKDYVLHALTKEMSKEVSKHMKVTSTPNAMDNTTTYTGTVTVGAVGASTVSGSNGTTISSNMNYSQINLRVVEYTKNGKVTRVELQKYDESSDDWFRIPRIQIEE